MDDGNHRPSVLWSRLDYLSTLHSRCSCTKLGIIMTMCIGSFSSTLMVHSMEDRKSRQHELISWLTIGLLGSSYSIVLIRVHEWGTQFYLKRFRCVVPRPYSDVCICKLAYVTGQLKSRHPIKIAKHDCSMPCAVYNHTSKPRFRSLGFTC